MPTNTFSTSSSFSSSYRSPASGGNTDPGQQQPRPRHCRTGAGMVSITPNENAAASSFSKSVAGALLAAPVLNPAWGSDWGAPSTTKEQRNQEYDAVNTAMQDRFGVNNDSSLSESKSLRGAIADFALNIAGLMGEGETVRTGLPSDSSVALAGHHRAYNGTVQNYTLPASFSSNLAQTKNRKPVNIRPSATIETGRQVRQQIRRPQDERKQREKRSCAADPECSGQQGPEKIATAQPDVVKTKIDYSCIEERNNAGFWDHVRNIGKTLQQPVLRMAQESQVIHFYNTEGRCPTPEEFDALTNHKGIAVADYLIRNGLTMLPGSQPLFVAQNIVGPALEMAADDAQGIEVSGERQANLLMNINFMAKATIDNNMKVIQREQAKPLEMQKSVIPEGMGMKNGIVTVKVNRYGRIMEFKLTERNGNYYATGKDEVTGAPVKERILYDDVSETWQPAETSSKFTHEQKAWFREHSVSITEGELADEAQHQWFLYETPDGKAKYYYDIKEQLLVIQAEGHSVLSEYHAEGNKFSFRTYYIDSETGGEIYGETLTPGEDGDYIIEEVEDILCLPAERVKRGGGCLAMPSVFVKDKKINSLISTATTSHVAKDDNVTLQVNGFYTIKNSNEEYVKIGPNKYLAFRKAGALPFFSLGEGDTPLVFAVVNGRYKLTSYGKLSDAFIFGSDDKSITRQGIEETKKLWETGSEKISSDKLDELRNMIMDEFDIQTINAELKEFCSRGTNPDTLSEESDELAVMLGNIPDVKNEPSFYTGSIDIDIHVNEGKGLYLDQYIVTDVSTEQMFFDLHKRQSEGGDEIEPLYVFSNNVKKKSVLVSSDSTKLVIMPGQALSFTKIGDRVLTDNKMREVYAVDIDNETPTINSRTQKSIDDPDFIDIRSLYTEERMAYLNNVMTPDEALAMSFYSKQGASAVNNEMRLAYEKDNDYFDKLDSNSELGLGDAFDVRRALDKMKPYHGRVFSGRRSTDESKIKVGGEYFTPSFMSSSISKDVALSFSGGVIYDIKLNGGGSYILGKHSEKEVLIKNEVVFKVLGKTTDSRGNVIIKMQELPGSRISHQNAEPYLMEKFD